MAKWTDSEDKVLLACIESNKKKRDAFTEAMKFLTNRTERACLDRWILLKNRTSIEVEAVIEMEESEETTEEEVIVQQLETVFIEEKVFEVDIVAEIQKVLVESNRNKEETEKLISENKRLDGENFDLKFAVSQLHNKKEEMEMQLSSLDDLIQKCTEDQYKYIVENESLYKVKKEKEALCTQLEGKIKERDVTIQECKRLIEVLKKEKEEAEQDNGLFLQVFNKARKMFTGTDKEEKAEFKMDRNGNLERVR